MAGQKPGKDHFAAGLALLAAAAALCLRGLRQAEENLRKKENRRD